MSENKREILPTPRHYQVIGTYDNFMYWSPGQGLTLSNRTLPNVPMAAERTLLAQYLRQGRHLPEVRALPRGERRKRESRPDYEQMAKDRLVGKLIGVEIEYYPESRLDKYKKPLENVVDDGSLADKGQEIRRLTWAGPGGRLRSILKMNLAGKVDKRCGLHVHIDARHLGKNGLLSAVDTYERCILFYPFLKKLVPESRLDNRYCRWENNCVDSNNFQSRERYCAINYLAYSEHGTFEFRCQGGSTNVLKIETWSLLCQWIVNFCAVRTNEIPKTWKNFLMVLPEPFKSWCHLRKEALYGSVGLKMDERIISGAAEERMVA